MVKEAENAHFESIMDRLRATIDIIETDDGGLEASLKAFEEGARLVKNAHKYLAEAEQRIIMLTEDMSYPFHFPSLVRS